MAEWGYLLFLIPLAIYETYAILTNRYLTISEIIWKAGKAHWLWRVLTAIICIWLLIHLVIGECAFGIC